MNRREFLKRCGLAGLTALSPRSVPATQPFRRRRPSDSDWPSPSAWKRLNDQVDGNLIPVEFPLDACIKDTNSATCRNLAANINNPYLLNVKGSGALNSIISHSGKSLRFWWFDPRTGANIDLGVFARARRFKITPPSSGENLDWILVCDDAGKGYSAPGSGETCSPANRWTIEPLGPKTAGD
jgi:hypothetical protein